jgi:site-specific DNA-methyltransferase (adenine-specific)/modification methylase
MDDNVTLYLGDCLDFMRTMPDKSVDAVITDPPYGVNILDRGGFIGGHTDYNVRWRKAFNHKYESFNGDDKPIDPLPFLQIGKSHIFWGGNHIANKLPASRGWLVWYKRVNGQSNNMADCELAWSDIEQPERVFQHLWMGFLRDSEMKEHYHPTQKPVALMRWCIELATNSGDTIFDPFMGSGTTGVACMQLGRKFIGCEIDPIYYAVAEKRIRQAQMQLLLPLEA